jgi:hypothetical protein
MTTAAIASSSSPAPTFGTAEDARAASRAPARPASTALMT